MITTESLLARLPSPPATALRLLSMCDDPETTVAALTEVVAQDPALATRVLSRANSAAVGNGQAVSTLSRAAVLLGLRNLRSTALAFSVLAGLPQRGRVGGLSMEEHWARCVVTAVTARSLAGVARPDLVEEAYLAGLLAHTGRVGVAVAVPEEHEALVARFGPDPGDEAEEEVLGLSATEFGAILLGSWGLPSLFAWAPLMAAGRRPTLDEGSEVVALAPVLELAGMLARTLTRPDEDALDAFVATAHDLLGLEPVQVDRILADLPVDIARFLHELELEADASTLLAPLERYRSPVTAR